MILLKTPKPMSRSDKKLKWMDLLEWPFPIAIIFILALISFGLQHCSPETAGPAAAKLQRPDGIRSSNPSKSRH